MSSTVRVKNGLNVKVFVRLGVEGVGEVLEEEEIEVEPGKGIGLLFW